MFKTGSDNLDKRVYLLSAVRLISSITSGFTLFCAPVHFINTVGIDGHLVGLGIGSGGIASALGRLIGGFTADNGMEGRKATVWTALALMAIGSLILSSAANFLVFVLGSVSLGLGFGLFSPAADALIADITPQEKLSLAYGYNRLANWLGLGSGLSLGTILISTSGTYLALFAFCAAMYTILLLIAYLLLNNFKDNSSTRTQHNGLRQRLDDALRDSKLISIILLNIGLTCNTLFVMTAVPLYLVNCMEQSYNQQGSHDVFTLFLLFIVICAVCQMPIAKSLTNLRPATTMILASGIWSVAFTSLWINNFGIFDPLFLSILTIVVLAIASAIYGPSATSYMVSIAPSDSRALYLSINSLCWGIARMIAPSVGLAVVSSGVNPASSLWLGLAIINAMIIVPGLLIIDNLSISLPSPVSVPLKVRD